MAKKNKKPKKKPAPLAMLENTEVEEVTLIPYVSNVIRVYNIGISTIKEFLKHQGYEDVTTRTLIEDPKVLARINSDFFKEKLARDKVRGVKRVKWDFDKKSVIQRPMPKATTPIEKDTHGKQFVFLRDNSFGDIKQEVSWGPRIIRSHFTDREALNLCKKMCSSFTRQICKDYDQGVGNSIELRFMLHHIANKAYKIYGGNVLTFWYKLPPLKFKNRTALEVRTYGNVIPDFPMITLKSKNESYNISFFLKRESHSDKLRPNIRVFTSRREHIAFLDEQGYVMDRLERFSPRLHIFLEATSGTYKFTSGVETGTCEICGKPLSDPRSLRMGIGPTCANNLDIDISFYEI